MAGEIATNLGDGDIRTTAMLNIPDEIIHDVPTACRDDIDPDRPRFWSDESSGRLAVNDHQRGFRWADGAALYSSFNTVLAPNTELCLSGDESGIGPLSTSSNHIGGTHVLMGDGAVIFITDSIECGESSSGTVMLGGQDARAPGSHSPYGLWGALGTAASKETIEEQLNQ